MNTTIQDQSYHFFIEEVPELLEAIEMGVLTLRSERSKNKIHGIMRAAHSLKGGAATVGLEAIKTIAHRLEDFFKALFDETLEIDTELETLLIQGVDCLKIPLLEQINHGNFDAELALENSRSVFEQIEAKLGDALNQTEDYIPSSSDLGVDIVSSIFEVDIAEGIENLERIVASPENYNLLEEVRNQTEVFAGFGELLGLPGFMDIIQTTLEALAKHPEKALAIANLMIADIKTSREQVLAGDRTSGGKPSAPLLSLTQGTIATAPLSPALMGQPQNGFNVRDQAYQFFIEEAEELLQIIETGLLTIRENRDKGKVHEIMRAAHSIKGGSASVGLDAIKTIAHRLEDFFKALFDETLEIDTELESDLLAAFDCLKNPLVEQIETGSFNPELALAQAEPVWERISAKMGEILQNVDNYIPSSTDLGVDIVSSIFQVDVAQEIERLEAVIANPPTYVVAGELKAALEVMAGFGEMLNLPGFAEIGQKALIALEKHHDKALEITQVVVKDLIASRQQVLAGDRKSGGHPSPELVALTEDNSASSAELIQPQDISKITIDMSNQAYQFFIEEADELLQIIEQGLLTIRQERDKNKVHEIMRAAHSIKGGSASVGLNAIKTIAHRLEDFFKALFDETIEIDTELESDLLTAFDCLRNPLREQIETGNFDAEKALADAQAICQKIEERLGDALKKADNYIPSSSDLGIDITSSIFEVDVAQEIENLQSLVSQPEGPHIANELKGSLEVLAGFGEMLNLPGFNAIIQTALSAVEQHPEQAMTITCLAINDLSASREQVLAGDRTSGGTPSRELVALTSDAGNNQFSGIETPEEISDNTALSSLNDVFGDFGANLELEPLEATESSLDDVFAGLDFTESVAPQESIIPEMSTPENIFGEDFSFPSPLDEEAGGEVIFPLDEEAGSKAIFPLDEGAGGEVDLPSNGKDPVLEAKENPEKIIEAVQSLEQLFQDLPSIEQLAVSPSPPSVKQPKTEPQKTTLPDSQGKAAQEARPKEQDSGKMAASLSVRVDLSRLERMNNLIGELSINRNGLSLQNDRLQFSVKELLQRFLRFQKMTDKLRDMSDQIVIAPERYGSGDGGGFASRKFNQKEEKALSELDFDALEMDSYGSMYSMIQGLLEQMIQLEEAVDDIALYAKQSGQAVEEQRQMLNRIRDELMWARMLPLGEVLNRFPRTLRDLSLQYNKSVSIKLSGTGVLVDKAALEKLYDPLLHLLRNAFDHGIEPPEERKKQGKPEEGKIEIRAYHQGNQTIIEIKDDGRGLNLEKISQKAVQVGLLSEEQAAVVSKDRLLELIFEAGFSTAAKVSELSGRGVGLDVVRSQLRALKGTIEVTSTLGEGTTFTLRLPLTLTIDKLLVCLVEKTAFAIPSDSIEEIVVPEPNQIKSTGSQKFLYWQEQLVPLYRLIDLLEYRCHLPEGMVSKTLATVPMPEDWGLPLLLLRRGYQIFALEVDRLVTEQELVIKPFASSLAAPNYTYGCTILGDGTLIPVINGALLLEHSLDLRTTGGHLTPITAVGSGSRGGVETPKTLQSSTILVVDDSAAMRRTLALSLEKAGYRVLQARDGKDALEQLQQGAAVQMVICDIEMPNMNGFEFLGQRRRESALMKIPIAMLTSRSNDKHRKLAMHLGASAYFTKPYIEQKFLDSINKLVKSESLVGAQ